MSGTNHTITTLTAAALFAAVGERAIVISRKNDGVQLRYSNGQFTTRSGAVLNAPEWWKEANSTTQQIPAGCVVIGELVSPIDGREPGQEIEVFADAQRAVVARKADDKLGIFWHGLEFRPFEIAGMPNTRFAERAALLANWYPRTHILQETPDDLEQVARIAAYRIAAGGEGLVIRLADAPGQAGPDDIPAGRWKVKSSETSEGEVISSAGFRLVLRENGVDVILRMSAAAGEADGVPQVGEIVEFKFSRRSPRGVPLNAGYLRRRDIRTLPAAAA